MKHIFVWLKVFSAFFLFCGCSSNNLIPDYSEDWIFPKDTPVTLQFDNQNRFRILQLTDLHYDQSDYRIDIMDNARKLVGLSNPDLIVITGDIVSGQPATYQWLVFGSFLSQLHRPFLITLGNHDSQYFLTRDKLYDMINTFPNCVNKQYEDSNAAYRGDMRIPIIDSLARQQKAVLYLFDSHDYNNPEKELGLRSGQTEWFKAQCVLDTVENADPTALVFMHVPIREYRDASEADNCVRIGNRGEPEYVAMDGNGIFSAFKQSENVCGMFCGHDHYNDYIQIYEGIALCYGRKSGSHNTYQRYPSGGRVIDIYANEKGFSTFIIDCSGKQQHYYIHTR